MNLKNGKISGFGPAVGRLLTGLFLAALACISFPAVAQTRLTDEPIFANSGVPGNLVLALSVEFPTAISRAHSGVDDYEPTLDFLGYFDINKCYVYQNTDAKEERWYFYPAGKRTDRLCGKDSMWSGNYLNWAMMQVIDPFRWALTGGFRVIDEEKLTVLEKAWAPPGQGSADSNFKTKSLKSAQVANATPLGNRGKALTSRVFGLQNKWRITFTGNLDSGTPLKFPGKDSVTDNRVYEFYARVKVCDSASAAGGLEANCKKYGENYKPEGLMQEYSDRIRYSAFGYLNDSRDVNANLLRDGAILRARQNFIGPTRVVPGQPDAPNDFKEWLTTTGQFIQDPAPLDSKATRDQYNNVAVPNSGVMNYLNKFGESAQSYKIYDPVSELYYAATRYLKNLGNVPEWSEIANTVSDSDRTKWVDGFPIITKWDDPIEYSCQRNFILGIGDTNSHADKNVAGPNTPSETEPTKPQKVKDDTTVDAVAATNQVGKFQGIANLGTKRPYTGNNNNNSALMAGLAYDSNTRDIRPDNPEVKKTLGKQTIQTYWLDVLESGFAKDNQFYLAAKYGGFTVPDDFSPYSASQAFPGKSAWSTTTDKVGTQDRPDNYFPANRPDLMVGGLRKSFVSIANSLKPFTTSFSLAAPQISLLGNASYTAFYSADTWTGEVTANTLSFDPVTNAPSQESKWKFSEKLQAQLAGSGWDSGRRVVTWKPSAEAGVAGTGIPFRAASLSADQLKALDPTYTAADDRLDFINYVRGSSAFASNDGTKPFRFRSSPIGDIDGSKVTLVAGPNLPLSDSSNPGYSGFKTKRALRTPVAYVGTNAGVVHAINASLTGNDAGKEIFAYIPSAVISGPSGKPSVDGLASRGNPAFTHKYLVNATPLVFDIDFGNTAGTRGDADWHSVLIGGLGKGGRGYYAIDVTDPASVVTTDSAYMKDEAAVAGKVLWEFSGEDMGFSFGDPVVVKTAEHGWVVIFTSGYNNPTGEGHFYIVNPKTGALIKRIDTKFGTATAPAGLTQANAFIVDRTNGVADAAYAGDLYGNVWRMDLTTLTTPGGGYRAEAVKIATLTDATTNTPQAITAAPLIEAQPVTNRRFVFVGTGRLLDVQDVAMKQEQAFYAITDGTGAAFNRKNETGYQDTLPTGIDFPITPKNLKRVDDLKAGITFDTDNEMGWYLTLGFDGGIAFRVLTTPTSFFGTVAFAATVPNGQACSPSGSSRIYPLDFGTGKSQLAIDNSAVYLTTAGVTVDLRFLSVGGKDRLVAGTDVGEATLVPRSPSIPPGLRRLNWRELPVVN